MASKLSIELLKFYQYINKKDLIRSKLTYSTIMGRLKVSNEQFEFDDIKELLNEEINIDESIEINESLIDYICDFFAYVANNDKKKAEICARSIYNLLENDLTVISVDKLVNRIKTDLNKLELKEKLEDKIDRAFYYGIAIIDVASEEQLNIYKQVIDEINNVSTITIEDGDKLVIINKNDKREKINAYELYKQAGLEYYNKNYEEAIKLYSTILRNDKTKVGVCGKLGLCYMGIGKYDVAIDYLKLATNINSNNLDKYDYTKLIYKLENTVVNEDSKTKFKMLEEDFHDDMNDYYGIEEINEIIHLVNEGYTIEESCSAIGLTKEQIDLVYLIYARECYHNCDYRNGDKFFELVQRNKNNSKFIKKTLETIRINKYYYKNRKREDAQEKILKFSTRY